MAHIYQLNGIDETVYVSTRAEVERFRFGGDELPESVERMNAAEECNRLLECIADIERDYHAARLALDELFDIAPDAMRATGIGRRAAEFIDAHPIAPATAADREGERSYGV